MPEKTAVKGLKQEIHTHKQTHTHTHTHDMLPETGPGSCASHDPHRRLKIPDVYIYSDRFIIVVNEGGNLD